MSSENTGLVEYYKKLPIMQYRDKPKAQAHIENIITAGMIYDVAIAVRDGFDVDTAIGAQQNILAKYFGVKRTVFGTTFTRTYYGYALYGAVSPFLFSPMIKYGDAPPDVQFRDYKESETSLYDLNDEEFRIIQKLAIVRNNSNASVKSIDTILNVLFGAECYFIDRMNMTVVSYMVGARWARIFQIAKSEGLLPNPAGVGTALVVVPDIEHIFSYSLYGGAKPAFAVGYVSFSGFYAITNTYNSSGLYPVVCRAETGSFVVACTTGIKKIHYSTTLNQWIEDISLSISLNSDFNISSLDDSHFIIGGINDPVITYKIENGQFINYGFISSGIKFFCGLSTQFYAAINGVSLSRKDNINGTSSNFFTFGYSYSEVMICKLSDNSIALIYLYNSVETRLEKYAFNESGNIFEKEGNTIVLGSGKIYSAIDSIIDNQIKIMDVYGNIKTYNFVISDWIFNNSIICTGTGIVEKMSIAFISNEYFCLVNSNENTLKNVEYKEEDTTGCMASYS